MLQYVHISCKNYLGQGAQVNHLDFHTAPEFVDLFYILFLITLSAQKSRCISRGFACRK